MQPHSNSILETSWRTMQMIDFATGMGGWTYWPWSGWIVGLIVASGLWLLVRTFVRMPDERGPQHLELDLPIQKRGELLLLVLPPNETDAKRAWVWWSQVSVR